MEIKRGKLCKLYGPRYYNTIVIIIIVIFYSGRMSVIVLPSRARAHENDLRKTKKIKQKITIHAITIKNRRKKKPKKTRFLNVIVV